LATRGQAPGAAQQQPNQPPTVAPPCSAPAPAAPRAPPAAPPPPPLSPSPRLQAFSDPHGHAIDHILFKLFPPIPEERPETSLPLPHSARTNTNETVSNSEEFNPQGVLDGSNAPSDAGTARSRLRFQNRSIASRNKLKPRLQFRSRTGALGSTRAHNGKVHLSPM
jgi:hypothetical protein